MSTKQQEREALEKIRMIVAELGEQSYLGSAFDGAFSLAKQNIEYDAAFSTQWYIDKANDFDGEVKHYQKEIKELQRKAEMLQADLDKEQEWKPHESNLNVMQADYEELVKAAHYMTDEEAKDWICDEFGFDRSKITILHEIDEEEVNRHRQCRRTGRKIDRRPAYCATDYHYIRFDVNNWYYEAWNGQLHQFYC